MKIDDHETIGFLFDGDKFANLRKRILRDEISDEKFPVMIVDVWHSKKKYQPGEPAHQAARDEGNLSPAFALIFRHRESIVSVREWLDEALKRFDEFNQEISDFKGEKK